MASGTGSDRASRPPTARPCFMGRTSPRPRNPTTAASSCSKEFMPGPTFSFEAEAGEARTEAPVPAAADAPDPVKLVISGANTVSLEGRVVDSAGKPVPEALVHIRSRPLDEKTPPNPGVLRLDGDIAISTDRNGHFETVREDQTGLCVPGRGQARRSDLDVGQLALAGARPTRSPCSRTWFCAGCGRWRGRSLTPRASRSPTPGPPVRRRADAHGNPVRRRPAISAFRECWPSRPSCSREEGYRFTGRSIGSDARSVEITLEPSDGPRHQPMKMLPPALSRDQEQKLLHLLFDPYAEQVLKQEQSPRPVQGLENSLQLDPVHPGAPRTRCSGGQGIEPRLPP